MVTNTMMVLVLDREGNEGEERESAERGRYQRQ